MATPIKLGPDESADGPQAADLSFVATQWSPDRVSRSKLNVKRVRSADDGPFMGGDWVLNSEGQGATLSFCFLNPEGTECFGLTVGHHTDKIGDSIFRFAESEPIPVPDDSNKEAYYMFEVGTVTSISDETDSLVFNVNLKPHEYHSMRIALSNKSHITLDQDVLSALGTPEKGTNVVGFGAQRRGAICTVTNPSKSSSGECSLKGDIGLKNLGAPHEAQSDGGDCGTIFCSVERMVPFYFHHVLAPLSDGTMISYGVPLLSVLKAHKETRHLAPSLSSDSLKEPPEKKATIFGSPAGEAHERAGLHQFNTKVVAAPRAELLNNPAKNDSSTEVSKTCTGSADSGAAEDQTLPFFNVRVKTRTGSTALDSGL